MSLCMQSNCHFGINISSMRIVILIAFIALITSKISNIETCFSPRLSSVTNCVHFSYEDHDFNSLYSTNYFENIQLLFIVILCILFSQQNRQCCHCPYTQHYCIQPIVNTSHKTPANCRTGLYLDSRSMLFQ